MIRPFIRDEILGMQWLNRLIGSLLSLTGLDMEKIMQYGVMSMPALVICEKTASAGKVLRPADIQDLIEKCC